MAEAPLINADRPLVLFPVRLETRFFGQELRVRIYPDKIHVDTHEPELTADELEWGKHFHTVLWSAATEEVPVFTSVSWRTTCAVVEFVLPSTTAAREPIARTEVRRVVMGFSFSDLGGVRPRWGDHLSIHPAGAHPARSRRFRADARSAPIVGARAATSGSAVPASAEPEVDQLPREEGAAGIEQ